MWEDGRDPSSSRPAIATFRRNCHRLSAHISHNHKLGATESSMDLESEKARAHLDEVIEHTCRLLEQVIERFEQIIETQAFVCGSQGATDSKMLFAQTLAHQTYFEFRHYYHNDPDAKFDAVCWLQKAFIMCRVFGSEEVLESSKGGKHVGKMVDPNTGESFGKLTALKFIDTDPVSFGQVKINHELNAKVKAAIGDERPVEAIRLLCDPIKHGVLSPVINLVNLKTARQIYLIGLLAIITSVHEYCGSASQSFNNGD